MADGVQFMRVGDLPTQPAHQHKSSITVMQDSATTGSWLFYPLQGYGGDCLYAAAGTGANVATWSATVIPGQYRVSTTWMPWGDRATNAPYTVLDGTTSRGTVPVNQRFAPTDYASDGVTWKTLGTFQLPEESRS